MNKVNLKAKFKDKRTRHKLLKLRRAHNLLREETVRSEKGDFTSPIGIYWWRSINWNPLNLNVNRVQCSIYKNTKLNKPYTVRRLQRILLKSYHVRLLAIRRVTQDNKGRRTAGVDGMRNLNSDMRLLYSWFLTPRGKADIIKRVWIPKSQTEKRPLGIPTIVDRCLQAMFVIVLEPEWEARFEPNSYGFRPGRSAHDAIAKIGRYLQNHNNTGAFVLDADLRKCFDSIKHERILAMMNHSCPSMLKQIKSWLKAGIMDNGEIIDPIMGTPQGGILSPMLANIALHGLESSVAEYWNSSEFVRGVGLPGLTHTAPLLVRYADDFVLLHSDLRVVKHFLKFIKKWLIDNDTGLEIHEGKTRIAHTAQAIRVKDSLGLWLELNSGLAVVNEKGFVFLGFYIFHEFNKRWSPRNHISVDYYNYHCTIGRKTLHRHRDALKDTFRKGRAYGQLQLIDTVNPIVRGICNYWQYTQQRKLYNKLDGRLFDLCYNWITKKHKRKKGFRKLCRKYFRDLAVTKRVFVPERKLTKAQSRANSHLFNKDGRLHRGGIFVDKVEQTKRFMTEEIPVETHRLLVRYIDIPHNAVYSNPVLDSRTPYDGNLAFWSRRTVFEAWHTSAYLHSGYTPRTYSYGKVNGLLGEQMGACALCNDQFQSDELIGVYQKGLFTDECLSSRMNTRFQRNNALVLHSRCFTKLGVEGFIKGYSRGEFGRLNIRRETIEGDTAYQQHLLYKSKLNAEFLDIATKHRDRNRGLKSAIKKLQKDILYRLSRGWD